MSAAIPRYDVLILSHDTSLRMPDGAAASLLRYMAATQLALPKEEAVAETWSEVYCEPGPASHEIFIKGSYTDPEPVFLELAMRFGKAPAEVDTGEGPLQVAFFIEIRGARFKEPGGSFRKRLRDLLYIQPQVFARAHEALPPHREVPEGEEPTDKRKKPGAGGGLAGTRVEEF